jgi:predicted unusual protein kinase regulating ubiquinone biosynthesis (AarF/ABC1/UbiB family)
MLKHFTPWRVWKVFRFVLTIFLAFRRKKRFLLISPLSPTELKKAILDLGVSFIKLAQVLATRADFFNEEYLTELRKIHDELEPMQAEELGTVYERAFASDRPFKSFENFPMASASVGQVHKAKLKDGTAVAVKIRRLDIEKKVLDDISLMQSFLKVFRPFFSTYTKHSLEAVISEFSSMIVKEVDMAVELDNLEKFRRLYDQKDIYFPRTYPAYSSRDALVMSYEQGIRIDDKDKLSALEISYKELLGKLVRFYTEQMLIQGFFHADPHPGNILVQEDGSLVFLDFGMVKRLPNASRVAMIEMVKSANEKNFELYIAACKRLGVVAANAPQHEMEDFAERMFDIFGNENLSAASMQALAFEVLDSMKELPFKLPQDVIYVMRVSSLLEGLGTTFIDNFNGVKDILPVIQSNLPRALGARAKLFPTFKEEVRDLPFTLRRIKKIIQDLSEDNIKVKLSDESLELIAYKLRRFLRTLSSGLIFLIAGFFVQGFSFSGHQQIAIFLFLVGVLKIWLSLR